MISTLKGDITRLDFDIIVNPANTTLMPGSGLCGAIFSQAGKGLIEECLELKGCEIGQVKITKSYNLPCKAIIHAVEPLYFDGNQQEAELLEACYWNSMSLAYQFTRVNHLDALNIAFPILSTEKNGYPKREACHIAVSTIRKLFRQFPDANFINVIFVCDDQENYSYVKEEIRNAFYG